MNQTENCMDAAPKLASTETLALFPELYHYTSREGLDGIVQTNTIWATHYRQLNDTTELALMKHFAISELKDRFRARLLERKRDSLKWQRAIEKAGGLETASNDEATRLMNGFYDAFFEGKHMLSYGEPYIASFCSHSAKQGYEQSNGLLSQWRGYANGGFCISFDTKRMVDLLNIDFRNRFWLHLQLEPVTYAVSRDSLSKRVGKTVSLLDEFFEKTVEVALNPDVRWADVISGDVIESFISSATLLKHEGFQEEAEIRIVGIPCPEHAHNKVLEEHPEFATSQLPTIYQWPGRSGLCSYIKLFENMKTPLPIKKVIVGPSLYQEENFAFARSILASTVNVVKSQTPYIG